jgi:hypothetical protein
MKKMVNKRERKVLERKRIATCSRGKQRVSSYLTKDDQPEIVYRICNLQNQGGLGRDEFLYRKVSRPL